MNIHIPDKHKAIPKEQAPKESMLRQLHNRVVGVKHLNGQAVKDKSVLTENFSLGLSEALMEECQETRAGKFLIELLAAVDYSGRQNRPLMLIGRKIKAGGFKLTVVVPLDTKMRPGLAPEISSNGHGVVRES